MSAALGISKKEAQRGVVAGLIAYTLWGVFPVYFVLVAAASPLEILAHRIIWAVVFGALILSARKQWGDVWRALTHRQMLAWLTLSAALISLNWLTYIWAIQNERFFESSLGYYINPLMLVVVGVLFFGDRLRKSQLVAVVLATIGVSILAFRNGAVPYVALTLGASFTAYGVIRKRVVIGAMPGLFVETLVLSPFALVWLVWLIYADLDLMTNGGASLQVLLLLAGPITVLPLLCFAFSARRLTLTTIGFMQFLTPTLQFCTGLYYGEPLTTAHKLCFGFIWVAVALFSADALHAGRKKPPQAVPAKA